MTDGGPRSPTLVVQTAFLGDVVLTTPLLSALAARHGPVDVVTTPAASALLDGHPAVERVLRYDKHGADRGIRGFWRLARLLRQRKYERAYLPHRSWRSGALAWAAGVPERIGFSDGAHLFYTRRVRRPTGGHEVERLLALAGTADGIPPISLALTERERQAAESWLAAAAVAPGFVAMAPGSIWGTKRWPYYGEVAARLSRPVVVVGGPEDRHLGEQIGAGHGHVHNAAGALSLKVSAALIARAAVLVTNDSAPLHLATAVGTPIVAIFGPTVPAFGFGPRGARDRAIGHADLACRPCSLHGPRVCPLGHHRCMRDVTVDEVLEAVAAVIEAR
jgi:heptosyltransferase-2